MILTTWARLQIWEASVATALGRQLAAVVLGAAEVVMLQVAAMLGEVVQLPATQMATLVAALGALLRLLSLAGRLPRSPTQWLVLNEGCLSGNKLDTVL